MQTHLIKRAIFIGALTLIILSACSPTAAISTKDWQSFTVAEDPGFDIQFQMPQDWLAASQAPTETTPGLWNVVIAPPECSTASDTSYSDYCINLTAYVKGEAAFDKDEVLSYISGPISLSEDDSITSILMSQSTTEVNGLTLQRFNHKIVNPEREIQMAIFYLESEGADYLFIYSVPYEDREGEFAMTFQKALETIKTVN